MLAVQKQQGDSGDKVIPILLPGIERLRRGSGRRGTGGHEVTVGPGGIEQALPSLFAARGEQLPDDLQPPEMKDAVPVADLILKLSDL